MIKILCVGKIKENYLKELILDYQKRISKYHKIEIVEIKEEISLEKEGEHLLSLVGARDYVITLEILGKAMTSEEMAQRMDEIFLTHSTIIFVIGSSYGLDERIKKRANLALSFSKMTFPHGLFRGILLEQIYRSFKILGNETYHK